LVLACRVSANCRPPLMRLGSPPLHQCSRSLAAPGTAPTVPQPPAIGFSPLDWLPLPRSASDLQACCIPLPVMGFAAFSISGPQLPPAPLEALDLLLSGHRPHNAEPFRVFPSSVGEVASPRPQYPLAVTARSSASRSADVAACGPIRAFLGLLRAPRRNRAAVQRLRVASSRSPGSPLHLVVRHFLRLTVRVSSTVSGFLHTPACSTSTRVSPRRPQLRIYHDLPGSHDGLAIAFTASRYGPQQPAPRGEVATKVAFRLPFSEFPLHSMPWSGLSIGRLQGLAPLDESVALDRCFHRPIARYSPGFSNYLSTSKNEPRLFPSVDSGSPQMSRSSFAHPVPTFLAWDFKHLRSVSSDLFYPIVINRP